MNLEVLGVDSRVYCLVSPEETLGPSPLPSSKGFRTLPSSKGFRICGSVSSRTLRSVSASAPQRAQGKVAMHPVEPPQQRVSPRAPSLGHGKAGPWCLLALVTHSL